MPSYRPGFSEADYQRLKETLEREFAGRMSFGAVEASVHAIRSGSARNAADVDQMLWDLEDLGVVRRLGGEPPRWQWIGSGR